MKKVGMLTFHAAHNYGSALQAYATQKLIEEFGYECEIVNYRLRNQKEFYNNLYSHKFGRKAFEGRVLCLPEHKKRTIRKNKFESFISNQLNVSANEFSNYEQISAADLSYDVLLTGSDQVWNTHCTAEFRTEPPESILAYFFAFDEETPKVSFSSSFGGMKEEEIIQYQKYLEKYESLSIREADGAEMLSRILNRDVENTLDPTLVLDANQWLSIASQIDETNQRYIFVYTLRRYKNAQRLLKAVSVLAHKNGMNVICVCPFSPVHVRGVKACSDCGPLDFISYINNAALVITDSFHGTAFSINLSSPFYMVQLGLDRRKELLLEKMSLSDRIIRSYEEIERITDFTCDFSETENRLNSEREQTREYLREALKKAVEHSNGE